MTVAKKPRTRKKVNRLSNEKQYEYSIRQGDKVIGHGITDDPFITTVIEFRGEVMTQGEFARHVRSALEQTFTRLSSGERTHDDRLRLYSSSVLSLSLLMSQLGLKSPQDSMNEALMRLEREPDAPVNIPTRMPESERPIRVTAEAMDLMNAEHRQLVGNSLRAMFAPLGIGRILIVGLATDEEGVIEKTFIGQIYREDLEPIADLAELFRFLGTGTDTESLQL